MTPRDLGGAISRAHHIYTWVPYCELEPDDEEEDVVESGEAPVPAVPAPVVVVAEGEAEEEEEEEEEPDCLDNFEGCWLAITRVQAGEIKRSAADNAEIDGIDIVAEEVGGDLYIGVGTLP